jgi:hypothetical protein
MRPRLAIAMPPITARSAHRQECGNRAAERQQPAEVQTCIGACDRPELEAAPQDFTPMDGSRKQKNTAAASWCIAALTGPISKRPSRNAASCTSNGIALMTSFAASTQNRPAGLTETTMRSIGFCAIPSTVSGTRMPVTSRIVGRIGPKNLQAGNDAAIGETIATEFYSRSRTHLIAKCCSSVPLRKFNFSLILARYVSTVATPSRSVSAI